MPIYIYIYILRLSSFDTTWQLNLCYMLHSIISLLNVVFN